MKTIIRPDMSIMLGLFAFGMAMLSRFRAAGTQHSASHIAATVAASGHPTGA